MPKVRFSMVPPKSDRIHFVGQTDVEVVLSRLPIVLWQRLRHVHFNDRGLGKRILGYVTGGRCEITLCALPPQLSLNARCRFVRQSPVWFGADWGHQWPVLAVRRFLLYDTFLHELGHIQAHDL